MSTDPESAPAGGPDRPSPAWRKGVIALVLLLWGMMAVAIAARLAGGAQDDFFITYRYARNLAEGHGFVYNLGERAFGLTNPGMGLLLALLHALTRLPVDLLGTVTTALGLLGVVTLLAREAASRGRLPEALAAGTAALGCSYLWAQQGGAWPVVLLLLALAARWAPARPLVAGLVAGLAIWFRPDAAQGALLLAGLLVLEQRRIPWRLLLGVAAAAGLGAGLAWLYFGAAIPQTLVAKTAFAGAETASWSGAERFWARSAPLLARHFGPAWMLWVALGLMGLAAWFRGSGRAGRVLLLFAAATSVAYPVLGVPFFSWYAAPAVLAMIYGAAYWVGDMARWLSGWVAEGRQTVAGRVRASRRPAGGGRLLWARFAGSAVAASLALVLLASAAPVSFRWIRDFRLAPHLVSYYKAANWLAENTPPESRVAYVEIGVLGYFSRRPIDDLMGLVTPRALPFVARGDLAGAFLDDPSDIVLFHSRGRMRSIVESPWFGDCYESVIRFRDRNSRRGRFSGVEIYRRRAGVGRPPQCSPGFSQAAASDIAQGT